MLGHVESYTRVLHAYLTWHLIWVLGSRYLSEFSVSNNYMSSLRTTTCDVLIVHSVNSVILIIKLNLTSLRNIHINMCVVLNEDHFQCICFLAKSISIWGWGSCCLQEFSLSNNYTVFVENHNSWRFDCTQWGCTFGNLFVCQYQTCSITINVVQWYRC